MKKILVVVILFFSVFGSKAQTFNTALATMLQDTLNTYVSQISNIKGMSASVYIPGQGIWTGVSGNSYVGQPITKDMRFGIASNSKLFCGVMLLKLAERNIISLEDSLKDWMTISNTNINPNITIRQLLNHTSGLSDPFFGAPWMDTILAHPTRVFTPNEVLNWIGAPLFAAGTSHSYSNTNYVLAGMVAKNATGYSLARLIRDSIFAPLNMDSSFLDVEESPNGTIAHRWWNRVIYPVTSDYHDTSRVGLNSAVGYAGSIFSTASEMVQWYNALFSGQVINQSSMNQLTNFVQTSNPSYQYGLGLSREITQGLRYWGHGGRTWGYKSKMLYDTCMRVAVCGLSNSDPSGMDAVTFLLYRVVKNHLPGCVGSISGTSTVCAGSNSITYTIPIIGNATSYTWTLPTGVTGSSTTNSITVNFGTTAVSGNITVRGVNTYGSSLTATLAITVNPLPLAAGIINGSSTVCQGQNGVVFRVPTITHATSYVWVLPAGATGTSTKDSIVVDFGTSSTSGNITVKGNNACGNGTTSTLSITVNPLPAVAGTIAGTTTVCQGQNAVIYTVPAISNSTSYIWTLPTNVSGSSTKDTIMVNFGTSSTSGNISVKGNNACGNGTTSTISITVNPLPAVAGIITGTTTVCRGQNAVTYSTPAIADAISYLWSFPTGATGSSTTNSIQIDYSKSATSGNISVKGNNTCGNGQPSTFPVQVTMVPTGISLNGFTLTADSVATAYQWVNCTTGYSPVSGATGKQFTPATSGNYAVILTSSNCTDTSLCQNVIINGVPVLNQPNVLFAYPNPVNATLLLDLPHATFRVVVYDELGKLVQEFVATGGKKEVDMSSLPNGMYFIQASNSNTLLKGKIVKHTH